MKEILEKLANSLLSKEQMKGVKGGDNYCCFTGGCTCNPGTGNPPSGGGSGSFPPQNCTEICQQWPAGYAKAVFKCTC